MLRGEQPAKDSDALHGVSPMKLLAGALRAIKDRNHLDTDQVVDGVFGCVTQTYMDAPCLANCLVDFRLNRRGCNRTFGL